MNKATVKYAFLKSLPVMAGYTALGTGFGVLLSSKGYSFWWAILMSITIYAGSMQYVGVNLLAGGASVISTALMTLMVNARHIFYGISMIDSYRDMGWRKWYAIFGLTDETYSIVCSDSDLPPGVNKKNYIFILSLMNQFYWIFGSFFGAFLGNTLSFNSMGIDFSMTALFVVIFVEQWEKNKQHLPAILGLAVSTVCLIVFGADNFLIPSMTGNVIGLFLLRNKMRKEGNCL
ncbi:MAG: AzlC family ABC transporter permease [Oscillospiraceae bacterium]|nr:AzlC family ABC transporter permease [Oscillospiraceae bacterium]